MKFRLSIDSKARVAVAIARAASIILCVGALVVIPIAVSVVAALFLVSAPIDVLV